MKPNSWHPLHACPWISATSKSDVLTTLPNLCLGCLRLKRGREHKCPDYFKEGGTAKRFCSICRVHEKLCRSPGSHPSESIPETFVGHGGVDPETESEDQAAVWSYQCANRGSLGSASLLTSTLTLVKGEDTITIEALWDTVSESSFFSAALLPFALSQRDQSFKIETLSPSATKPEIIHGVKAVFQVAVPGG